jgi:hypothetical protein
MGDTYPWDRLGGFAGYSSPATVRQVRKEKEKEEDSSSGVQTGSII